jgi:hypothetical protein
MVNLSRIRDVSGRQGEGSIREVSLLAMDVVSQVRNAGDALDWAGRTYQIEALDDGGYLHVRPVGSSRLS